MADKIILIIGAVAFLAAYFYVMRYNLHMFQLNGYKNGEHFNWLKKNIGRQTILVVMLLLGAFASGTSLMPLRIIFILGLCICIYYFRYLKVQKTKKKLVYTNRVKRLMVTDIVVNGVIIALCAIFLSYNYLWVIMGAVLILQSIMMIVVNIINKPVENGVNRHFINDAKRRLKETPQLKIIGVTGSYGKTSVKYYLNTLLQTRYNVLITPESYNTPMGVVKTIRGSLKSTDEIFICEMGARHVGDIKEICDIVHPMHGIITSIGPQHLETFFSMDNIVSTKFELADALPKDGMLFVNGDNSYIREKSGQYENVVYYNTEAEVGGYHASDIKLSQMGTEFVVTSPEGESESFQLRLVGAHNVINVVGAIAVANKMGIALKDLRVPVRKIQPVEHRMQMRPGGSFTIIDDAYNSNPVGSKAAVETLAMFDGVRILITPGMVELGASEEKYNYEFGTYAADCCDYVALVGRKHTEPIARGLRDKGFKEERIKVFDRIEEALNYAYVIKDDGHKYILLENDLPDNY